MAAIESVVFEKQLRLYDYKHVMWKVECACYSSICAPQDHFKDKESEFDLRCAADEYMMDYERCESRNNASTGVYNGNCKKRCLDTTPEKERCYE